MNRAQKIMRHLVVIAMMIIFQACEFTDTEKAIIPSYISIPSFTFQTDTVSVSNYQGSNHHKFTDMWVNVNGNSVGATGLPLLLPVQKTGINKVNVEAGVVMTGQDDRRIPYPFIATYSQDVDLVANAIDTVKPVFTYLNGVKFNLVLDCDKTGHDVGFDLNPIYTLAGDTIIKENDNGSMETNNAYLKVVTASASTSFQMVTSNEYVFNGQGSPVYLEFNYNTNVMLRIGYYYTEPTQPPVTSSAMKFVDLFPTSGWNKVYLNLTDEISARRDNTAFKFFIGFFKGAGEDAQVSFDNIKLISF